jgi:hypothetical protein
MNPTAADLLQAMIEMYSSWDAIYRASDKYENSMRQDMLQRILAINQIRKRAAELAAARQTDSVERNTKIDRDEGYERDYIPLPGGCEVQTKGRGSSFRVVTGIGTPNEQRLNIPDSPYLHETLERMARDIHAATFGAEK